MVFESFMIEKVLSEVKPEPGANIFPGVDRQDCEAFLFLDFRKNVLFLSSAAERVLEYSGLMKLVSGRLSLGDPGKQIELNSLIETCFSRKEAGSVCLEKDGFDPLLLMVSTVQPQDLKLSSSHGLVVVFIVKKEREGADDWLGQRFGLTETESKIANHISQGLRPTDIAKKMFLSVHTVRHHIKKLYRKAGVHSQAQLTALVLSAPW